MEPYVIRLDELGMQDAERVGGKNASLGEMIAHTRVRVPGGFATTVQAYRDFLANDGLADRIDAALGDIDIDDIEALAKAGRRIRQWILGTPLPRALTDELKTHWNALAANGEPAVAVRSSATAEDLPDASFAGQQETFLNVRGFDNLIASVHRVFASLFNDRAIAYRVHNGFEHRQVALNRASATPCSLHRLMVSARLSSRAL